MFSDWILKIYRNNSDKQQDRMQVITVVLNLIFSTFIRTSCAFGGATSTSSIEKGLLASHITAALHLITCKQSKEKGNGICICKSLHRRILSYISACETRAHIWGRRGKTTGTKTPNPKCTKKANTKAQCKPAFFPHQGHVWLCSYFCHMKFSATCLIVS